VVEAEGIVVREGKELTVLSSRRGVDDGKVKDRVLLL
jgi:hypothetical protein